MEKQPIFQTPFKNKFKEEKMKISFTLALILLVVILSFGSSSAQDDVTIVAPTSEAA